MAKYAGIERVIFSDLYNFFLKFKDIPDEKYYWDVLNGDAKILKFKFKDHPFACGMVDLTVQQLTHIIKKTTVTDTRGGKTLTREQWEAELEVAKIPPKHGAY